MRIIRVTSQNVWRLGQLERTPDAVSWIDEAEDFLHGGRAIWHLRRPGTAMLAADDGVLVGVGIAYVDQLYQQTTPTRLDLRRSSSSPKRSRDVVV